MAHWHANRDSFVTVILQPEQCTCNSTHPGRDTVRASRWPWRASASGRRWQIRNGQRLPSARAAAAGPRPRPRPAHSGPRPHRQISNKMKKISLIILIVIFYCPSPRRSPPCKPRSHAMIAMLANITANIAAQLDRFQRSCRRVQEWLATFGSPESRRKHTQPLQ